MPISMNRAQFPGVIDPNAFTPYPKNPTLAWFFVNIGRADTLGSGVRNLYKYVKIYCGESPELKEGDVFRTFVPLQTDDARNMNRYKLSERQQAILDSITANPSIQVEKIMENLGVSRSTVMREVQEIKKVISLSYNKKTQQWKRDFHANLKRLWKNNLG